jgi:catechol 2,3-dioxygenase-like lactoylglutathione lyase family enzyme
VSRKPSTLVRVRDIDASLAFYVEQVGARLVARDTAADVATIDYAGYLILLAGPNADAVTPFLGEVQEPVRSGATIFLGGATYDGVIDLRRQLEARGVRGVELIERPWGDRVLTAPDPDGYTIAFWATIERTTEETLTLYDAGPDALDAALAGLSDAQLDLARAPDSWMIRQIVHHLADSEATVLGRTKFALAEPGRLYLGNPYAPDRWADGLDYAGRDIAPAVALFRAIRAHMSQLMRHLPDAWERSTRNAEGVSSPAGDMIGMLVSHAFEHIEEIRETRQHHGV